MSGILLYAAIVLAGPPEQARTYKEAHAESVASGRPLLVLVGADWCPACRDMKYSTMPRLQREGKLDKVAYAIVDVDRESRLASQLMRSSSIPQLVLYAPGSDGWHRLYLQGSQSVPSVLGMIERGRALQRQESAANVAE